MLTKLCGCTLLQKGCIHESIYAFMFYIFISTGIYICMISILFNLQSPNFNYIYLFYLQELESPFKISGVPANPFVYNVTKVVVLSAFSAVLTELLGFKLKLYKINFKGWRVYKISRSVYSTFWMFFFISLLSSLCVSKGNRFPVFLMH